MSGCPFRTFTRPRHCEPTGRANARPMTGSAKQSILPARQDKTGLLRRFASRNDGTPTRHAKLDCFVACAPCDDESNVAHRQSVEMELMTRIAVGGFLHETNTFAPTKATYDDFVHGGGWPAMAQGTDVLRVMRNINIGLAGFVGQAEALGWEMGRTSSCGATPSAHVTTDAYERIVKVMVEGIAAAGRLDAVYLDLHGAMVTEHLDDGEGELLARVRRVIGKHLPLVVSLDLHANVTPAMVEHADALIAYRTYPHVDMADTGRAAARHLALLLRSKHKLAKAFRQLPFLIPISWRCTSDQPTKGI